MERLNSTLFGLSICKTYVVRSTGIFTHLSTTRRCLTRNDRRFDPLGPNTQGNGPSHSPLYSKTKPSKLAVNLGGTAALEAAWPTIAAVFGVGVGLAGLIWQLQRETGKRIENLEFRMQSIENGLAELKGSISGLTVRAPQE